MWQIKLDKFRNIVRAFISASSIPALFHHRCGAWGAAETLAVGLREYGTTRFP